MSVWSPVLHPWNVWRNWTFSLACQIIVAKCHMLSLTFVYFIEISQSLIFLLFFYLIFNYVPSIGDWLICRKMSIFFYIWLYMDMKADGCTKAVFINHFSSSSCFEMLCKRREIPCDFWKLMLLFISTFF